MSSDQGQDINFQEICNNAMMAILIFERESWKAVYINRMALEALEMDSSSESTSLLISDLFPESEHRKIQSFSKKFLQEAGFYQDIFVRRKNNHKFIANLGVQYLADGKLIMLMLQDVSFQKKLQREVQVKQQELMRSYQEILEQNKELQNLDEAKDKLILLSTHELRTPLSAIIAMSEALSLGLINDAIEQKSYLDDIHRESQSLMKILNNMLDLLKLKTKKMPFFISLSSVNTLVEQCISFRKDLPNPKQVKIQLVSVSDTNAYLDKTRTKIALNFLLDNAIEFSPVASEVTVSIESNDDFVRLEIADRGKGIPLEHQQKVFEEFNTLTDIESHSKGTGLSLSIAKHSFDQMACRIWLDANYTEGAKFCIEFPKSKLLPEELYSEDDPFEDIDF